MKRPFVIAGAMLVAYVVLALVGVLWGKLEIPAEHVLRTLAGALGLMDATDVPQVEQLIVLRVRLPQVVLVGLVGAALACCGAALQATFENPLAEPSTLGVTGGAALGAVLAIHTGLSASILLALPVCAFSGALAAALLVYAMSYLHGRPTVHSLLLTGVAVGSLSVAGISLVMVITEQYRVQEVMFWLVGGVRQQTWVHVGLAVPGVLAGCAGIFCLHRRLDALLLGEEQALAIGVHVAGTRLMILGLTALATGAATAVSGTIGFVGLMVPHVIRRLTGPRLIHVLPACITGGAAFLTACELLSRALSDKYYLHLGILTSFLGVPAFMIVLGRTMGGKS